MPVYNAEKYVEQAIQSIIDQTFQNWELFVIDDASKDRSLQEIEKFDGLDNRIKVLRNKGNKGKVKSVNSTVHHCKGKYLTIHDADDWSEVNRFERQVSFLENNPFVLGCGTNYTSWGRRRVFLSNLNLEYKDIRSGLLIESQIHGPTLVFKQETLKIIGVVYRDFFDGYNEDYDLCVRLASCGELVNLKESLYNYRITSFSLSRTITPKKKNSPKVVRYLANQRFELGYDDLDKNIFDVIYQIILTDSHLYQSDKSLLIREQAEYDFYNGFFFKSLGGAIVAIKTDPFNFKNWRLIQYVLRKRILGV